MVLAGLVLGCSQASAQQDGEAQAPARPGWNLNCSGPAGDAELTCTLTQRLVLKGKGQRVLTAVVNSQDGKPVLSLGLPHGLDLPKGVSLWVDEAPRQSFEIATADQKGSYAVIGLDHKLLAALRKGKLLNVAVKAYAGEEIILQLSLESFSAGFARL
nr:invasion associated locus B family protein [Pseudaminobacter soli]